MTILYTIGYEGIDIESFVATLKAIGIKRLADVRAVALSRKKGFSKKALSARLEAEGIGYWHFVELGDPKPGREAARAGRYKQFHVIYESHLYKKEARIALSRLEGIAGEAPTCLLCFERDPATCHRLIVANKLAESGFEVFNLYGDEPDRYVRNASKLPRYYPRESPAAA